jgi:hypothetical protein
MSCARACWTPRSRTRRGELRISVPIGFVWHREIGLGLDPDCRVQEVTRGIFQRFRELGSARQVHMALKRNVSLIRESKAACCEHGSSAVLCAFR